jgi:hypothetical protein
MKVLVVAPTMPRLVVAEKALKIGPWVDVRYAVVETAEDAYKLAALHFDAIVGCETIDSRAASCLAALVREPLLRWTAPASPINAVGQAAA